jgi:carbamoyl-phosphate synthase small subunit
MLGKIVQDGDELDEFWDPNQENLVARVSVRHPREFGRGTKKVLLLDCGCKSNIVRSLVRRGVAVKMVPWDWDITSEDFDGLLISNGPGDPAMFERTIEGIRRVLEMEKPTFGICLGHQLLARAAGASTYKLKFGHRSQNQPCIQVGTKRCYITSQNHGYAVEEQSLPAAWEPWFLNANDGTNEGIRHHSKPFFSVQFHPEASPGPTDTGFLFDYFLSQL